MIASADFETSPVRAIEASDFPLARTVCRTGLPATRNNVENHGMPAAIKLQIVEINAPAFGLIIVDEANVVFLL